MNFKIPKFAFRNPQLNHAANPGKHIPKKL